MFLAKQSNDRHERWVSANASFFRMHRILDIFFVGGFGTVQWVSPGDYALERPDSVVADRPYATLKVRSSAPTALAASWPAGGTPRSRRA